MPPGRQLNFGKLTAVNVNGADRISVVISIDFRQWSKGRTAADGQARRPGSRMMDRIIQGDGGQV